MTKFLVIFKKMKEKTAIKEMIQISNNANNKMSTFQGTYKQTWQQNIATIQAHILFLVPEIPLISFHILVFQI